MRSKVSLVKEITSILDNAKLVEHRSSRRTRVAENNMFVAERVNEQGYKCTYCFFGGDKDALLKRAASIQKGTPIKFKEWQNGNKTQKVMLFLKENKEALQLLYDIHYLMKTHKYDVQEACSILFKDKKKLPPYFRLGSKNGRCATPIYLFDTSGRFDYRNIEYFIGIARTLPKSYLEGIDVNDNDNSN